MSDYPSAYWLESPFFGYPQGKRGREGQKIVAIVDHMAQGTRAGMRSVVLNEGASTHYFVGKDGQIDQYVNEVDAAWGNGLDFSKGYAAFKSDKAIPWIADCWANGINSNLVTISIEHEGYANSPLTEAQYQATLALHKHLCTRWAIPADGEHIVGHNRIDGVNRPNDPGPAFPWTRLLSDLGQPAIDLRQLREHISAMDALVKELQDRVKGVWSDYGLGRI